MPPGHWRSQFWQRGKEVYKSASPLGTLLTLDATQGAGEVSLGKEVYTAAPFPLDLGGPQGIGEAIVFVKEVYNSASPWAPF